MARPANRRNPCFCRKSCPDIFVPHLNYRFRAPNGVFPGYFDWKLMKFEFEAVDGLCVWLPAEPLPASPPVAFAQDLRKTPGVGNAYQWAFKLVELPNSEVYILDVTYDDDDVIVSGENPACDQLVMLLTVVGDTFTADLEAVPEWMCTDLQARAWPAS